MSRSTIASGWQRSDRGNSFKLLPKYTRSIGRSGLGRRKLDDVQTGTGQQALNRSSKSLLFFSRIRNLIGTLRARKTAWHRAAGLAKVFPGFLPPQSPAIREERLCRLNQIQNRLPLTGRS
jgi:hypothetical protein